MAIISIPTSIGGVSIPGAALKGPLGKLFGNKNNVEILSYPRDLQSATRNHVVQFRINEVQPVGYEKGQSYGFSEIFKGVANSATDIGNAAIEGFKGNDFVEKSISAVGAVSEQTKIAFTQRKTRLIAGINLYMPDTLEFTNAASYNQTSLLEVASSVLESLHSKEAKGFRPINFAAGVAAGAIAKAQTNAAKLGLATQGLALNPQQQLLFDGIDFRTFQMSFTFTPFSKDEATTVKNIVKMFKTHAAPRIVTGAAGMFFIPPSTFNLEFFFNGEENKNIGKVAECVIETIDVNYAPNGWSSHTDGSPVQTTMSISFKEIELIDREKIEKDGY